MLLNSWNKNANLFRNASNNLNVFFHTPNKLLIFQVKIYNRICLIAGYPSNFPRYSPHLQIYQSTFPGHHNKPPIFRVIATCHQSQKRVPILCCFPRIIHRGRRHVVHVLGEQNWIAQILIGIKAEHVRFILVIHSGIEHPDNGIRAIIL